MEVLEEGDYYDYHYDTDPRKRSTYCNSDTEFS